MSLDAAGPRTLPGVLFILGSALCFATMGTIVKDAYVLGASATGLLAVRMLAATAIWALVLNRRLLEMDWRSPSIRRLALGSVAGIAAASLAEYASYRYLPVALVVVILFMSPAWVALAQWVTAREGVGAGGLAGLALLGAGLVLLTRITVGEASLVGIALALFASLGIAVFFTLAGRSIHDVVPTSAAALVAISATCIVLPIALVDGTLLPTLTSAALLGRAALLGIVATVTSLVLLLNGVRRLGAFPASVVSCIEPVFAALIARVVLGEVLTPSQIVGGLLVIAGTIVVQARRKPVPGDVRAAAASS